MLENSGRNKSTDFLGGTMNNKAPGTSFPPGGGGSVSILISFNLKWFKPQRKSVRVKCIGAAPAVLLLYRGGAGWAEPPVFTPFDPHSTMSTVRPDNCQVVQVTPTIPCGIRNCNKRSVRTRALTRFYRPQGRVLFWESSVILSTGEGVVYTPLGKHPHPVTATAADGTHPTGMYSCFFLLFWVFFCTCKMWRWSLWI